MRVIKEGKVKPLKEVIETCHKCDTIFSYTTEDIKIDIRDGNYVICPICKCFINAETDKSK